MAEEDVAHAANHQTGGHREVGEGSADLADEVFGGLFKKEQQQECIGGHGQEVGRGGEPHVIDVVSPSGLAIGTARGTVLAPRLSNPVDGTRGDPPLAGHAAGDQPGVAQPSGGEAQCFTQSAPCGPQRSDGRKLTAAGKGGRGQAAQSQGPHAKGQPHPHALDVPHDPAGGVQPHRKSSGSQGDGQKGHQAVLPGGSGHPVLVVLDHGEVHAQRSDGPEQPGPL